MDLEIHETAVLDHINNRVELHGDEKVPAADIDLTINDIEAGELDQFALDGNMLSTMLWHKDDAPDLAGGYKLGSPKLGLIKSPLTLDIKVENHRVAIAIESADDLPVKQRGEIIINPAVIKKIKFTPQNHGTATLSLQVAGCLPGAEVGKIIDKYLGQRVDIKIMPAENAQAELLDESPKKKAASG